MARRRVLITGISSFIGYHLARAFSYAGYEVIGSWKLPLNELDELKKLRRTRAAEILDGQVRLDFNDGFSAQETLYSLRFDVIVHCAGIGKDFSSDLYDQTGSDLLNDNSITQLYVAAARQGARMVLLGSSMEYGLLTYPDEEASCDPISLYGISRCRATRLAQALSAKYSVPSRVGRVFSLCGELDAPNKLVEMILTRLRARQTFAFAPGVARDICDIGDVAQGFVHLASPRTHEDMFEIYNLCRGSATDIEWMARFCAELFHIDTDLIVADPTMVRVNEPLKLAGDCRKARAHFGWTVNPIDVCLERLVNASVASS